MPLYEYECPHTGKRFEAIQKFSDAPLTRCPDCDAHPECPGEARKLLSVPAIQFKGEGWYVTEYGKGGKLPVKDGAAGDSKPADSGDKGAKKETKAAPQETASKSSE
jgi:putative FmdB family regulatory protein